MVTHKLLTTSPGFPDEHSVSGHSEKIMKPVEIKEAALADYKRNEPLKVIAKRYNLLPGTVSLWGRKAKIKRRRRGTRLKEMPSERDMDIVARVRAALGGIPTLAEIGKNYPVRTGGTLSRSGVHRVYHRWKDWKPTAPFEVDDIVRHAGHDYLVLRPRVFDGDVRNLKTGTETKVNWRDNSEEFVVKVGHRKPNGTVSA